MENRRKTVELNPSDIEVAPMCGFWSGKILGSFQRTHRERTHKVNLP